MEMGYIFEFWGNIRSFFVRNSISSPWLAVRNMKLNLDTPRESINFYTHIAVFHCGFYYNAKYNEKLKFRQIGLKFSSELEIGYIFEF